MNRKEIKTIVIAVNSSENFMGKYPIGNAELTEKLKKLELKNLIQYDVYSKKWNMK